MFLTSQRVVSPSSGQEGINAFLYLHGAGLSAVPPQSTDLGRLVAQSVSVPPPGNRIRSYFDIWAPDDIAWPDVRIAMMNFVGSSQPRPLPWEGIADQCFLRLGMELSLAQRWQGELAALFRAAQALRLAKV